MTQAVERLTAHVRETGFDALSPQAVVATKTFCLDTLGVSVAGTRTPHHVNAMRLTAVAKCRQNRHGWRALVDDLDTLDNTNTLITPLCSVTL